MKISKVQQKKNRKALIDAAVLLSRGQSIKSVSMKSIAQEAGLSDAAIYNYFPSKEKIITGYLEEKFRLVIDQAKESSEFKSLKFCFKLQWLVETQLECLEGEEEFVNQVYNQLFEQPISISKTDVGITKRLYVNFLSEQLLMSSGKGEFEEPPFSSFICELLWDMHLGVIHYWLKDQSEEKINTSQVLELSLDLFNELLNGKIFSKVYKVGHYLFKEHLMSKLFNFGVVNV